MDAIYVVVLSHCICVPESVELEDLIHGLFINATTTESQLRYFSSINMVCALDCEVPNEAIYKYDMHLGVDNGVHTTPAPENVLV